MSDKPKVPDVPRLRAYMTLLEDMMTDFAKSDIIGPCYRSSRGKTKTCLYQFNADIGYVNYNREKMCRTCEMYWWASATRAQLCLFIAEARRLHAEEEAEADDAGTR